MAKKKSILEQVCSPAEAAEILGVSRERVLQFCREGRVEARQMDGGGWVIVTESLHRIEKLQRGPKPKE